MVQSLYIRLLQTYKNVSEYWISVPRKFCDFCKCWITDNKPSVDFHEKGKRHQEAVQRRLKEVRKKSYEQSLEQDTIDKEMAKMEKAALEAFKKDLAADPKLAKQYGVSLEPKPKPKSDSKSSDDAGSAKKQEEKTDDKGSLSEKEWYEAKSPNGYSYYWSTVSGESRWEAPEEFVSLEEQEAENNKYEKTESNEKVAESADTSDEEESSHQEQQTKDPSFSRSAFGSWSVVKEESRPVLFDNSSEAPLPDDIPLPQDIPLPKTTAPKFKEKTVKSLGPSSDSGVPVFKKRKIASGARNVRQRNDDD